MTGQARPWHHPQAQWRVAPAALAPGNAMIIIFGYVILSYLLCYIILWCNLCYFSLTINGETNGESPRPRFNIWYPPCQDRVSVWTPHLPRRNLTRISERSYSERGGGYTTRPDSAPMSLKWGLRHSSYLKVIKISSTMYLKGILSQPSLSQPSQCLTCMCIYIYI